MARMWWIWGTLTVGAICALWMITSQVTINAAPDKVGTALMALVFVALLIERVVEVFVAPLTGGNKQALEDQLVAAQAKIAEYNTLLKPAATVDNPVPTPPDAALMAEYAAKITALKLLEQQLSGEIKAINRQTQRIALSFSVPISVVVALAGLRAIGPLVTLTCEVAKAAADTAATGASDAGAGTSSVDKGKNACSIGPSLLAMADVVLTAGLLAGGADGIHKILDNFIGYASGNKAPKPN